MEDHVNVSNRNARTSRSLVASRPKEFAKGAYGHIVSLGNGMNGSNLVGSAAAVLLKVAALEVVRRISRAKFPFAWRGLQALQLLCYPPLKWIQRWDPFKGLVKGMETLSKPLLILSIATAISEEFGSARESSDSNNESRANSDGSSDQVPASDSRNSNDVSRVEPITWLFHLRKELENQGINIPDRINDDELRMFYDASNEDISSCLSSVKKTIRWRETYRILTEEELRKWSDMVFWHGFDVKNRLCLIVRLGYACLSLPYSQRPCFAQAVVSQMEYGVIHLMNAENTPQITVIVDCEGLPPYRIPMQMLRSCFSLLQDHYPNRLGCLFVIRLQPVVRVIARTLIQVLKPATREKLRIEGDTYQKVLSEYLQMLPLYLGGKCSCDRCRNVGDWSCESNMYRSETRGDDTDSSSEDASESTRFSFESGMDSIDTFNQVIKTSVMAVFMLLIFVLIAGLRDPDTRSFVAFS